MHRETARIPPKSPWISPSCRETSGQHSRAAAARSRITALAHLLPPKIQQLPIPRSSAHRKPDAILEPKRDFPYRPRTLPIRAAPERKINGNLSSPNTKLPHLRPLIPSHQPPISNHPLPQLRRIFKISTPPRAHYAPPPARFDGHLRAKLASAWRLAPTSATFSG
jgi:hypothetical protein